MTMALPCTHFSPASITTHFDEFDHNWNAGNIGFRGNQIEKCGHGLFGVEKALVHVYIEHVGAAFDLLACDREGCVVVAGLDELAEFCRAGDVGPLAGDNKLLCCAGHVLKVPHRRDPDIP